MNQNEEYNNTLKIGSMLEEFEILSILGVGGFGITYKVKDTNLDTIMVIKEYMPSSFASRSSDHTTVSCISQDRDMYEWGMQRFLEEAKLLRKFEHISIVKTHRVFKANGTAYFVMEFYEGETLDKYLKAHKNKRFTQDEILAIMMPIVEGLKAVHAEGFLHRDISPDNIFLRRGRMPILIDFGASRNALVMKSQNISTIIKPGYSPAEQYTTNLKQDETTDLYAISAVLYQMITGERPPESTHRQSNILNEEDDPITNIVDEYQESYDREFLETIQRGLSLRQKDRIQSIREFQEGLVREPKEDAKEDIVIGSHITHPSSKKCEQSHRLLVSLFLVLLIALGGLYYQQQQHFQTLNESIGKVLSFVKASDDRRIAKEKKIAKEHNEKHTFYDKDTNLTWQDDRDISISKNWKDAKHYCQTLDRYGAQAWRLPTKQELKRLYTQKENIKNIKSSWYWTSTKNADNSSDAWIVYFKGGDDLWVDKSGKNYALCVRG